MRALKSLVGGMATVIFAASAASAADVAPVVSVVAPVVVPPPAPTLSAYLEGFGAMVLFLSNEEVTALALEGPPALGLGAAAHLAWQPRPAFSLQADAWVERWRAGEGYMLGGAAVHATVHAGNFLFGSLVSVGYGFFGGTYVNVAGEVGLDGARFIVRSQAGYVFAVAGSPVGYGSRDIYTQTVATFYARPNLALSVGGGADYYREIYYGPDYWSYGLNIGTRVEFQPEGRRFSVFGAYQLDYRREIDDGFVRVGHYLGIGLALMFGQPDLQARDLAVGLGDGNPMFGPTFPP